MSATAAYDRTADRDALQQQMDEYARQGGMISKLDYAGNLVGLEAETPSPRPTAKVLPMQKRDPRPVVQLTPVEVIPEPEIKRKGKILPFPAPKAPPSETVAEWCERVAPAPTAKPPAPLAATPEKALPAPTGITKALRTLRADAERALARLNAAFHGGQQ